jgi:hypothetical protein
MPGGEDRLRAAIDAASVYASCTEEVVDAG